LNTGRKCKCFRSVKQATAEKLIGLFLEVQSGLNHMDQFLLTKAARSALHVVKRGESILEEELEILVCHIMTETGNSAATDMIPRTVATCSLEAGRYKGLKIS